MAQPHVPGEPILAAAIFSRPGAVNMAFEEPGLDTWAKDRRAKKASGGLPMNVLLVVTASKVHVFDYKLSGFGKRLKRPPMMAWDRSGVSVLGAADDTLTTRLAFEVPDLGTIELDAVKGQRGLVEDVVRLLADPAAR